MTAVRTDDDLAFAALAKSAEQHAEPALQRALHTAWKAARHGVSLTELRVAISEKAWATAADIVGRGKLAVHVRDAVEGQIASAFLRGVDHGARPLKRLNIRVTRALTDLDIRALSPYAREWAQTRAGELVDAPADVQAHIREIVTQAVEDDGLTVDEAADLIYQAIGLDARRSTALANYAGQLDEALDPAQVAARIAEYSGVLLDARAMMIARTEIMAATNAGQKALWDAAREDGMLQDMQLLWIVTDDNLCCDDCQALADAGPVEYATGFPDGDPPLHPQCRCTFGLVHAQDDGPVDDNIDEHPDET